MLTSSYLKNYHRQPQINQKHIAFGKGMADCYLDIDGTFCKDYKDLKCEKRGQECFNETKESIINLDNFFKNFKKFLILNFTTGRNKEGYRHLLKIFKRVELDKDYLSPRRLIINNGGDIYENPENMLLKEFMTKGMLSEKINTQKIEDIKKKTNWDSPYILHSVLKSLEDYDFPVLFAPDGNGGFGDKSAKNILKDRNSWTAFIRQTGNFNYCIGLPPEHNNSPIILEDLANKIIKKLDQKGISYVMGKLKSYKENSGGPAIIIAPRMDGEKASKIVKIDKPEDWQEFDKLKLNKSYDIAEAIKEAQKNGDLVIFAGNDVNDLQAADPETYEKIFKTKAKNLPFMIVVVGDDPGLRDIAKKYPDKVIQVADSCYLLNGIKSGIKKYAEQNPKFEQSLESKEFDFKKEIGL